MADSRARADITVGSQTLDFRRSWPHSYVRKLAAATLAISTQWPCWHQLVGRLATARLAIYAVALLPPTGWKDLYVKMLWNLAVGLEWASCIEKWFFCSENLLF